MRPYTDVPLIIEVALGMPSASERADMIEPETFKKAPKRKSERGRRVAVGDDAKKAYEALIREKEEREKRERHLPPDMQRR